MLSPSGNTGGDGPARGLVRLLPGRTSDLGDSHRVTHALPTPAPTPSPCCLLHPAEHTSETEHGGYDRGAPKPHGATARLIGTRAGVEAVRGGASSAGGGDHDGGEDGGGASAAER